MNKNIIYTFDEQTKEKNQYELKDFLDCYLSQGYSYEIASEFAIQHLQEYYRGL